MSVRSHHLLDASQDYLVLGAPACSSSVHKRAMFSLDSQQCGIPQCKDHIINSVPRAVLIRWKKVFRIKSDMKARKCLGLELVSLKYTHYLPPPKPIPLLSIPPSPTSIPKPRPLHKHLQLLLSAPLSAKIVYPLSNHGPSCS